MLYTVAIDILPVKFHMCADQWPREPTAQIDTLVLFGWDIFIEISLLAFTGPKDFEISTSSIEEAASSCRLFVVSCATVIPVYLTGQLESDM